MNYEEKLGQLSPALQKKIVKQVQPVTNPNEAVSNFLMRTKKHCTGGATIEAGLWLRDHTEKGGKIAISMAGAGSSFQMGIVISDLIRAGKVAALSVTGANLEESLYRYVAHDKYVYIPDYVNLTPEEEMELRDAGLRRITDTFLPEDESVRLILPKMEMLWRKAEKEKKAYLWHEYFWELFRQNLVQPSEGANPDDCWLLQALKYNIPIFVPGREDSTMGNIFSHACYNGNHEILSGYKLGQGPHMLEQGPISPYVVLPPDAYTHAAAEWYMNTTKDGTIAYLQMGGGIAGDYLVCVVPHLLHDYHVPRHLVKPWAAFIEIHSSPMVYGSYSGAGHKEKITWDKTDLYSYGKQLLGDYTQILPDIVALMLRW